MTRFSYLLGLMILLLWASACKEGVDPVDTNDLPRLVVSSVTLTEGNEASEVRFVVNMSATSLQDVEVSYETVGQTAEAGTDFVSAEGVLTIPAGSTSGEILVEIIADTLREQDETFDMLLSNAVNATLSRATGTATIRNDDSFVDVPAEGYITPESYAGYKLVWQDEFEGTQLNTNDWTPEIGAGGWGNEELQYYTDRTDNAFLTDGNLVIEAKEETFSGSPYTSARLITKEKQFFRWGRVDIRAILPEGQGIWPALWMLGENISTVGWPACGEIDIMELVGHEPSTVHGTAHWGPQGQGYSNYQGEGTSLDQGKFSDKYHVFSIIWEPGSIRWLVDEVEYFQLSSLDVNGSYPFDADFFFIFNIAVGGRWPGYPDATTVFPQRMYVDYIRVFQED